ncbi:MAG TPA: hypothetical protein VIO60_05715 [Rectinemataceae bacterium]
MDRNRRFSRTGHFDEAGAWYSLDNAGIIMPAVADRTNTTLFRIEAILSSDLDPPALAEALKRVASRFPYFDVVLKRGFFWYYLDHGVSVLKLLPDESDPCQGWNINEKGRSLVRILFSGRRIACEFSHALTDGYGGLCFVKSLIVEYCRILGVEPGIGLGEGAFSDILDPSAKPDPTEWEDAYHRFFPGRLPPPEPNPRAWHIGGETLPKGRYRIIVGSLELDPLVKESKRRGVTLTEFLSAVYLDALQDLWFASSARKREHFISLEIPVNLRRYFSTKSLRNFSLFILLRENLLLGRRDFEELVKRAHYQMRLENDIKSISRQIARNAGGARHPLVRAIPLFVKDFFARILFAKLGETMLSGFLSNLGKVELPPAIEPFVESFVFIPAPSSTTLVNAAAVAYKDKLTISFGSLASSREMERLFFSKLRSLGFVASVRCRGGEE